ncbi:hypothetical protein DL771_001598 [Monosporascus sp. 5C6A]|nr:hypothetical protein DL771_001598 [Monosporascus sp. 5C6A]
MHEAEAKKYFPEPVRSYLFDKGGYDIAYRLLANDPEVSLDQPYPDNGSVSAQAVGNMDQVIRDLDDGTKGSGCSFTYCAIAAEFLPRYPDRALYQFSMGAFSTVNWILKRVYNKDERLTVLSRTQVLAVGRKDGGRSVDSLTVRDCFGTEKKIPVGKATVILSAGTIGTAAIALRSNIDGNRGLVGKGLMDHDIWGTRFEVLQNKDTAALHNQPLRLQSWVRFNPGDDFVLLNITVNANTFLGQTQEERFPTIYLDEGLGQMSEVDFRGALGSNMGKSTIQVVFEFCAPFEDRNKVLNLPEPATTIEVQHLKDNSSYVPAMQLLSQAIGTVLAVQLLDRLKRIPSRGVADQTASTTEQEKQQVSDREKYPPVSQLCCSRPASCCINPTTWVTCSCKSPRKQSCPCRGGTSTWPPRPQRVPLPTLSKAGFGAVAHEVGTMRMGEDGSGVVDENLRVSGVDNLYICDLSVFPVSPAANPTLTLAALAQRLGSHLLGMGQ